MIEIEGGDVETVTVTNTDGTPVTAFNEHTTSSIKGGKKVIYALSGGDYIFHVACTTEEGSDVIVTPIKVTVSGPGIDKEPQVVKVPEITDADVSKPEEKPEKKPSSGKSGRTLSGTPQTGDESNAGIYVWLALCSVVFAGMLLLKKKRKA